MLQGFHFTCEPSSSNICQWKYYLGFSWRGGSSFEVMMPIMVKIASSTMVVSPSLICLMICQEVGFLTCLILCWDQNKSMFYNAHCFTAQCGTWKQWQTWSIPGRRPSGSSVFLAVYCSRVPSAMTISSQVMWLWSYTYMQLFCPESQTWWSVQSILLYSGWVIVRPWCLVGTAPSSLSSNIWRSTSLQNEIRTEGCIHGNYQRMVCTSVFFFIIVPLPVCTNFHLRGQPNTQWFGKRQMTVQSILEQVAGYHPKVVTANASPVLTASGNMELISIGTTAELANSRCQAGAHIWSYFAHAVFGLCLNRTSMWLLMSRLKTASKLVMQYGGMNALSCDHVCLSAHVSFSMFHFQCARLL